MLRREKQFAAAGLGVRLQQWKFQLRDMHNGEWEIVYKFEMFSTEDSVLCRYVEPWCGAVRFSFQTPFQILWGGSKPPSSFSIFHEPCEK